MKKLLLLVFLLTSSAFLAQTGINTQLPLQPLHIDGKKDNNSSDTLTPEQMANDVVVSEEGKLGIGTINPTAKLDVRGEVSLEESLTIKDINLLESSGVRSLYINESGAVGIANVQQSSRLAYFETIERIHRTTEATAAFNAGEDHTIPLSDHLEFHIGGIVEAAGEYIKIKEEGYYQFSLLVNPYIIGMANPKRKLAVMNGSSKVGEVEIEEPTENEVFFRSVLQYSTDNGASWTTIVGIRPKIQVLNLGFYYPQVFPTTVARLDEEALVRVAYSRSKGSNGSPQGKQVQEIFLGGNTNLGLSAFQLAISKI